VNWNWYYQIWQTKKLGSRRRPRLPKSPFSTVSEGVVRMASTWYVGFSALMMALKSCSILLGGKRRKFDGEGHQVSAFFSLPIRPESHSSRVAFLNLQLPPSFRPGINPFFAKRWMVRTWRFKYKPASLGVKISFIRFVPIRYPQCLSFLLRILYSSD